MSTPKTQPVHEKLDAILIVHYCTSNSEIYYSQHVKTLQSSNVVIYDGCENPHDFPFEFWRWSGGQKIQSPVILPSYPVAEFHPLGQRFPYSNLFVFNYYPIMVKRYHLVPIIVQSNDGKIPILWLNDGYILITIPSYSYVNPRKKPIQSYYIPLNPGKIPLNPMKLCFNPLAVMVKRHNNVLFRLRYTRLNGTQPMNGIDAQTLPLQGLATWGADVFWGLYHLADHLGVS
jgi:hypothetical protein